LNIIIAAYPKVKALVKFLNASNPEDHGVFNFFHGRIDWAFLCPKVVIIDGAFCQLFFVLVSCIHGSLIFL